jgi:hypothetical protein
MKEIIDLYNQMSSSFEELLKERTPDEIAYDNIVIKELRKGRSIKKALKIGGTEYPSESLEYKDDNIDDIHAHYEYFFNHELIKAKMRRISN